MQDFWAVVTDQDRVRHQIIRVKNNPYIRRTTVEDLATLTNKSKAGMVWMSMETKIAGVDPEELAVVVGELMLDSPSFPRPSGYFAGQGPNSVKVGSLRDLQHAMQILAPKSGTRRWKVVAKLCQTGKTLRLALIYSRDPKTGLCRIRGLPSRFVSAPYLAYYEEWVPWRWPRCMIWELTVLREELHLRVSTAIRDYCRMCYEEYEQAGVTNIQLTVPAGAVFDGTVPASNLPCLPHENLSGGTRPGETIPDRTVLDGTTGDTTDDDTISESWENILQGDDRKVTNVGGFLLDLH